MEPIQVEPPTTNNKLLPTVLAGIVIAALVAGGGVYAYQKNQNDKAQADLQSQIDNLKIQIATKPTAAPAIAGTVFNSTIVNLSFTYPSNSSYAETEPLKFREARGLKETGHQVNFSDKNKLSPDFDATTTDFTTQDSIPHDLLVGTLDSKSSFSIASFDKNTMITNEVSPGIFQATAYGNMECSPGVSSYLFVRPPQNSGLKYISFYLGGDSFPDSEISSPCGPTSASITKRIANLSVSPAVTTVLNKAVTLAKTFSIK